MASISVPTFADAKQKDTAQLSLRSSTGGPSSRETEEMRRFSAILAQLRHDNIISLVQTIRQGNKTLENKSSLPSAMAPVIGCKVVPKPLYGSYHLAYRILFEDGVEWILKIPANGHQRCFDRLAAEALTSEALTMRMIKQTTTIPVPTVHHFNASIDNEIGCPYILMDFLKGKPLWQGWLDEEGSPSTVEQFRARSLQTIAAAMVQLSQFTLDRGGSLRFDSDGRPVDVAGAKVPDWAAELDAIQGLTTLGEDCPYCEKGPIADPASSFLFMLDHRGFREKDGAYDRGIHEVLRLFTKWTLEKSETADKKGPEFVLAHPDFALQNFLVEEDGTLCGIIDWDGVAAVPLSVGCLKYPDWLISDWNPWYDYHPGNTGQQGNSPEKLATYRIMYAQFVEVFSSIACGSGKAGKLKADTTRMSLVAGSIDFAATDLKITNKAVNIIFEKLEALNTEDDASDVSDYDSGSSIGTDSDDVEEENSAEDTTPIKTQDKILGDVEKSNFECLRSKCVAELGPDQPPLDNIGEETDRMRFPAADTSSSDGSESDQERDGMFFSSGNGSETAPGNKKTVASRKAKVAEWALNLGEKGCRGVSKVFHKEEAPEQKSTRKARVAKWALGLGGDCCKRASKAFHKKEEASDLQPKDLGEAMPGRLESQPASMIRGPTMNSTQTSTAAEVPLLAKFALVDTEHCQSRNPGEENPCPENRYNEDESAEIDSEDVWARIAAKVDKGGIPIGLIKKHHDVIAQCVIRDLGKEVEREKQKEKELRLGNRKATREQAEIANTKDGTDPEPIQYPTVAKSKLAESNLREIGAAEPDIAQSGVLEEWVAEVNDGQANMTNWTTVAGAKVLSEDVEKSTKSESENAVYSESIIRAPTDPSPDTVDPDHSRTYNDESAPLETESLISKLEAAKKRFDIEMGLKGQSSGSLTPGPGNTGVAIVQVGDAPQQSAHDFASLEGTEEANRKLRMVLSNLSKPKVAVAYLNSNTFNSAEDSGTASEQLGHAKSETLEQDIQSSEAIDLANQKLRTVLLSLQEPKATDTKLQPNMSLVAEGEDEEPESEEDSQASSYTPFPDVTSKKPAARFQQAVKGGRWFETPRGSLKRINVEEELHDCLDDQGSISRPNSCSSENNGGSSKTSVASREDENLIKSSDFQLTFANHNKSEAVNHFQVPDIDEDDEEYDVEGFTKDDNGGEGDELEISAMFEEARRFVDDECDGEGEGFTSNEVTEKPSTGEIVDSGNFHLGEICVALGNGSLDEQRMTRLKEGFMALLDDTVGRHRRVC